MTSVPRRDVQNGRNAAVATRGRIGRAWNFFKRTKGPSYISPRTFALVVLNNLAPDAEGKTIFDEGNQVLATLPPAVRQVLQPLVSGPQKDAEKLRTALEAFYDDTMARVSGWYKRKTQIILIVIGIVLVPAINANTIKMGERMWKDNTVRAAVVAQAQAIASPTPTPTGGSGSGSDADAVRAATQKLNNAADGVNGVDKVGIPMGWRGDAVPRSVRTFAMAVGGWILTVLAISLGAPFWFDTLSRLSRLRSSGKPETPLPASASGQPNERILTPPQGPVLVIKHDAEPDRPEAAG